MTNIHRIDVGVFDPSHRKAGSYWQWVSASADIQWDRAAEMVNQAWPARMGDFKDQHSVLYGVLDEGASGRWLYRVYPGGRDSLGRPGRYFFVIFLLQSPEQVTLPEVADILCYFDTERSLPLATAPLQRGLPAGKADHLLSTLYERWISGGHGDHWGMDGNSKVVEFSTPSPTSKVAAPSGAFKTHQKPLSAIGERARAASLIERVWIPLFCAAIGSVFGFFLGFDLGSSRQVTSPPPLAPRLSPTPVQPLPVKPNERPYPQRQTETERANERRPSDADTQRERPSEN